MWLNSCSVLSCVSHGVSSRLSPDGIPLRLPRLAMVVSDRHHAYCCGGWGRERQELVGREVALVNLRASWWPAQDSLPAAWLALICIFLKCSSIFSPGRPGEHAGPRGARKHLQLTLCPSEN